jgi:predicted glycosyltransferase
MSNVVFMVKNGIGYGHLRRALLLASALQESTRLTPVVISQASTLDLFRDSGVRVLNLPLIERTGSDVLEDRFTAILDSVLVELDPSLVIEDTYPDPRYLALPSLTGVPRMLIMRRLDGTSLDQIRRTGRLTHYDAILIAQDHEQFVREGHSGQTLAAVEASGKFTFVGNVHAAPTLTESARERARYVPNGEPLVVAAAGAGGDQMADGFCDRLFHACAAAAASLAKQAHPARFVLVTGPYFAGREISVTDNVTVHRYYPRLAALLRAADVAVLKPGNNVVSEALLGRANLVLSPDTSFMEGLDEHAARLVGDFGGVVSPPTDHDISAAIRGALAAPRRTRGIDERANGVRSAVAEIERWATGPAPARIEPKHLLLITLCHDSQEPTTLPPVEGHNQLTFLSRVTTEGPRRGVIADCAPPGLRPQALVDAGARMLLEPLDSSYRYSLHRWMALDPPRPALIVHPLTIAHPRSVTSAMRAIARATAHANRFAALLLDLRHLEPGRARALLERLRSLLNTEPVVQIDVTRAIEISAQALLEPRET